MTNWADDIIEEETDEEEIRSDGDVLGEVTGKAKKKVASVQHDIPVEEQWEIDAEALETHKVCSSPCYPNTSATWTGRRHFTRSLYFRSSQVVSESLGVGGRIPVGRAYDTEPVAILSALQFTHEHWGRETSSYSKAYRSSFTPSIRGLWV